MCPILPYISSYVSYRQKPPKLPNKSDPHAVFCSYKAHGRTQAGQEHTKRPRSKRPRDARKTYLCGCWSAYCRSDIGLQPRTVCRCHSWSALKCKPCCCGCSNSSLSCKRGPADAGGAGVVNRPRRHCLRRARSRKKLRFACMWRIWLRIPQHNRAGGIRSARQRLPRRAQHYGHLPRARTQAICCIHVGSLWANIRHARNE